MSLDADVQTVRDLLRGAAHGTIADRLAMQRCPVLERARARARRRGRRSRDYAHVDCALDPWTICVAADLARCRRDRRLGVLLHEVGHWLHDVRGWTKPTAAEVMDAQRVYGRPGDDYDFDAIEHQVQANAAVRHVLGIELGYGPDKVQRVVNDNWAGVLP